MKTKPRIAHRFQSQQPTLAQQGRPLTAQLSLPSDLLRQSVKRLQFVCLVWAALWSIAVLLNNVVAPIISPDKPLDDAFPWPGNPVAIAIVAVSLAVFAYTRRHQLSGARALDIGLAYEVLVALAIGIVNQWTPNIHPLSWICVLVVTFPIIVPNTTTKTLAAALLAASMDPVGLALTSLRGEDLPNFSVLVWAYLPNYVCAFLAILPSHVIRHLGHQVTHARRLGSYQLGELLGRGGMGEVYRAHHRMLARPAAIKLIRPEVLGTSSPAARDALIKRFEREANAAALLSSPHTIDLYDFGVADDGTLFYVMELLEGIDLETLVTRFGPLPAGRVVDLLQQVCHSLAEAHERGLIHRDIKPSNILTCRVGLEVDFVKVLDFGLVRLEQPVQDVQLTTPEMMAGTPAFMSPEVAVNGAVDRRSDLYSLGCVAYWLLTGRLVFEADTPIAVLVKHSREAPEPPSRHSELAVPEELEAIVLACLAKTASERPRNATELRTRLAACSGFDGWTDEQARRWWDDHLPHAIEPAQPALELTNPTILQRSLRS